MPKKWGWVGLGLQSHSIRTIGSLLRVFNPIVLLSSLLLKGGSRNSDGNDNKGRVGMKTVSRSKALGVMCVTGKSKSPEFDSTSNI